MADVKLANENLRVLIEERGKRILKRFRSAAVSGVNDPKLLEVLQFVNSYWEDNLRPAFTSLCCEVVGTQPDILDDACVILGLVDAGISIHDDIIDNSQNKHLRRTVLGEYGLNHALLVGDLLIVKAWSLLHRIIRNTDKPLIIAAFIEAYGRSCIDMCEAELLEISCRKNLKTDLSVYEDLLWKRNSGIKACAQLGAILADGAEREINLLSEVGKNVALMLGLKDELRDLFNVKYLLHRLENESVRLPILYSAKSSATQYTEIESIVKKPSLKLEHVKLLLKLCKEADAFTYIGKIMDREAKIAISHLDSLKPSKARENLKLLVENIKISL